MLFQTLNFFQRQNTLAYSARIFAMTRTSFYPLSFVDLPRLRKLVANVRKGFQPFLDQVDVLDFNEATLVKIHPQFLYGIRQIVVDIKSPGAKSFCP